jgi:serine/threonine protein kinase
VAEVGVGDAAREVLYLPMDYANGGSCDKNPPFKDRHLSVDDFQAMRNLLEGLQVIHDHADSHEGITHEDIKPANILQFKRKVNDKEETYYRITDFGIAKLHSALHVTPVEAPAMTLPFMCPEQRTRDRNNTALVKKGDIYSMGATLFYMLTGRLPIEPPAGSFSTQEEVIQAWKEAHEKQPRPNAMKYSVFCPPRLALLIMRMMSREPDDRPDLETCKKELQKLIRTRDRQAIGMLELPEKLEEEFARKEFPIRYVPEDFRGIFKPGVHKTCEASQLFVIRIKMGHPIYSQYEAIIDYLVRHFSDTFSLYETWGTYDINLLLWGKSDDPKIKTLKADLERVSAGCQVQVRLASEIHDFHCADRDAPENADPIYALAVQEGVSLPGLNPDEYLCKKFPDEFPEDSIRAFTYVEPTASPEGFIIRNPIIRIVQFTLEEMMRKDGLLPAGQRKFRRMSMIELADSERATAGGDVAVLVVSYVASRYKHLSVVPTRLIDELGVHAVKTSTFLETRRVVFQSDKILL